jgi:hypothetical protein
MDSSGPLRLCIAQLPRSLRRQKVSVTVIASP